MKRSLGFITALFLLLATSTLGGANAASPKVGSKCTKLNQKIKVAQQNLICSKSGKKLVWVKAKSPAVVPPKKVTPTPSKSPSPAANNSSQTNSSEESKPATATNIPSLPSPTSSPSAISAANPASSSGSASSSNQTPSVSDVPTSSQPTTEPNAFPTPSPSPTGPSIARPLSNVLEKSPVSLSSPTITGIKNGAVPTVGQVLTCSGWKWDQEVPQTTVSWIAYPSNTGSDIIDPNLYTTLSTVVAIGDSKLEISTLNIGKISGNYLYCFATAKTAGGLETTSIAALLLGK
jgi:hypothetical protein